MMTAVGAAALAMSSVLAAAVGPGSSRRVHADPPPDARAVAGVLVGVAIVVALLVERVPAELPLAVAAAVSGSGALRRRRAARSRCAARAGEVTTFCFAVAAELRAGRAPADAMAAAAAQLTALERELAAAARACRLGAAVDEELAVVARTAGCERLVPVAAAWSATGATGARIADVLERIGTSFGADDVARMELSAQVAGPQATVVVLAMLPLVAIAFGSAVGARPTTYLLHTGAGWLLLVGAAVLDATGVVWMRRITSRALAR